MNKIIRANVYSRKEKLEFSIDARLIESSVISSRIKVEKNEKQFLNFKINSFETLKKIVLSEGSTYSKYKSIKIEACNAFIKKMELIGEFTEIISNIEKLRDSETREVEQLHRIRLNLDSVLIEIRAEKECLNREIKLLKKINRINGMVTDNGIQIVSSETITKNIREKVVEQWNMFLEEINNEIEILGSNTLIEKGAADILKISVEDLYTSYSAICASYRQIDFKRAMLPLISQKSKKIVLKIEALPLLIKKVSSRITELFKYNGNDFSMYRVQVVSKINSLTISELFSLDSGEMLVNFLTDADNIFDNEDNKNIIPFELLSEIKKEYSNSFKNNLRKLISKKDKMDIVNNEFMFKKSKNGYELVFVELDSEDLLLVNKVRAIVEESTIKCKYERNSNTYIVNSEKDTDVAISVTIHSFTTSDIRIMNLLKIKERITLEVF